ncbi:MAG: GLPGLI family protein [Cryomorphaceae bacterium]|nr:GLPGLI family protein [Cryomorphaceae bacterium]
MKKIFVCGISAVLLSLQAWAQTDYISSGKIIFERRTNLEKRFNDQRMKRFVTEANKIRIESFQLAFNDTSSYFAVLPSNEPEEMAWLTTKNAYYQNLNESSQLMMLAVFGQNVYVQDSLPQRIWKITEGKRIICGYECRKAIYQKNDSTRLYAWYSPLLTPSVGPEGFCGLPGTILGLATEDGGIVYFAKKIDLSKPKQEELLLNPGKNKVFTIAELRQKIEKDYGSTPWGKSLFNDLFRWL